MKALAEFSSGVVREVGAAPNPTVEDAIRDSAIHFCTQAYVWIVDGFEQQVSIGTDEYFIQTPRGGRIQELLGVYVDGLSLALVSDEMVKDNPPGYRNVAYLTDNDRLKLHPAPTQTGTLVTKIACCPTVDANALPDVLYDRYQHAIEQGALATLKAIPGQPWTRQEDVAFHLNEQRKAIAAAKGDRFTGRVKQSLRARPRRFC